MNKTTHIYGLQDPRTGGAAVKDNEMTRVIHVNTNTEYGRQSVNVQTERSGRLGFRHYLDVTASTKKRLNKLVENGSFSHQVTITEDDGIELEVWDTTP